MDGSPSPKTQLHSIVKPWNGRTWILLAFLCAIHLPTPIQWDGLFRHVRKWKCRSEVLHFRLPLIRGEIRSTRP